MKTIDYQIIPKNLRRIMKEKKLTNVALAKRMGTYDTIISNYKRGTHCPSANMVQELAMALDVEVAELYRPMEGKK